MRFVPSQWQSKLHRWRGVSRIQQLTRSSSAGICCCCPPWHKAHVLPAAAPSAACGHHHCHLHPLWRPQAMLPLLCFLTEVLGVIWEVFAVIQQDSLMITLKKSLFFFFPFFFSFLSFFPLESFKACSYENKILFFFFYFNFLFSLSHFFFLSCLFFFFSFFARKNLNPLLFLRFVLHLTKP